MLIVPALVGAGRAGFAPVHAALAATLLAGWLWFNAAGLAARAVRRSRYAAPLLVYGAAAAACGAVALWLRPSLLAWLVLFVPLAAVSLLHSWRRADRALSNDAATIAAACLFAAVMYDAARPGAARAEWEAMGWVVVALFAYFFGTALYVKTVIRERANPAYHRLSVGYHAAWAAFWAGSGLAGVPAGAGTRVALSAFFAVLTARAALMAGRRVRPLYVGLGEIVASVAVTAIALTW